MAMPHNDSMEASLPDSVQERLTILDRAQLAEQERLSQHLREAREFLGLSQEFVAEQLGLSRAAVSAIETNRRKVSSVELKQFARLYHLDLGFFFEDAAASAQPDSDQTVVALFRTTKSLSSEDKEQVLRFAQFLRHAKQPPVDQAEG